MPKVPIRAETVTFFSKGVRNSLAVNFAPSAGPNCESECPLYGNGCYAERLEGIYAGLSRKLERHLRQGMAETCRRAMPEIVKVMRKLGPETWIRISSNGSVAKPHDVTKEDVSAMRDLLTLQPDRSRKHFPAETKAKATFWREKVGDLACVRESCVTRSDFINSDTPCSFVVGMPGQTAEKKKSIALSVIREKREATGRKCILCPAIAYTMKHGKKAKGPDSVHCGGCRACADDSTDVIYPRH